MSQQLRRWALPATAVAVVIIIAVAATVAVSSQPPANAVKVRLGNISASVNATGQARAKKSARLSLPQPGVIAKIDKVEGDEVNGGDVILALKADEAQRRVEQAELNLKTRQLDLARAKAAPRGEDIAIAQANLRKATAAAAAADAAYEAAQTPQNTVAREMARADLDIARANFNRTVNGPTQEEVDALQNAVAAAQIDLASAQAALAQTKLTAPFASTVTEIVPHEGELIGSFTPLASVADLKALEIAAQIDEIDVAHVQVGQTVQVRFDAFPGQEFGGRLVRLFPASSTARGTNVYGAVVDFNQGDYNVRPGMGANLKIQTVEKNDVLLVPNNALKSVGTRKAVHVVSPGEPRDVIVETGVTDGISTEIISGLNGSELVTVQ
jgi:HlyD family secretion protein